MGVNRKRLHRVGCLAFVGTMLAYVAPTSGLVPPLLMRNTADSMPKGIYVYSHGGPVARGEVIIVRRPPHFSEGWLVKRAVGIGGDHYCWDPALGTQRLNGRAMPAPLPEAIGMGIPVWRGCRTLSADEVVGYGETPDSYDSRYLGPVKLETLWGVYRPISG